MNRRDLLKAAIAAPMIGGLPPNESVVATFIAPPNHTIEFVSIQGERWKAITPIEVKRGELYSVTFVSDGARIERIETQPS